MKIDKSRRNFNLNLGGLGISAVTANTLGLSGLLGARQATAASSDYKALVYVYLDGGNDSFNMVVPKSGGTLRTRYEEGRGSVALAANDLHALNLKSDVSISSGETYNDFGMHPECNHLADLFNSGELGVICNVANLVEPLNRSSYQETASQKPPGLFSHSDQARQLMSEPVLTSSYGWGGRIAEFLDNKNLDGALSPLITPAGANVFQKSLKQRINSYSVDIDGITATTDLTDARSNMLESIMAAPSSGYFSDRYREVYQSASNAKDTVTEMFAIANDSSIDYDQIFTAAGVNLNATGGDANVLALQLMAVAKLINGKAASSNDRPIFFVRVGGFDHHAHLLEDHAIRMNQLNSALKGFRDTLNEQGDFDSVLTHVGSEFGRTFTSNSTGTDHGWGGHMMVMGGAVNGGHMFGHHPDLVLGGDRDCSSVKRGIWIPETSNHQTAAKIAQWFGVSDSDLETIFPSLENFDSVNSQSLNIDFMT